MEFGEALLLLKTSGMETFFPVAGGRMEGSITRLSFTEVVKDSYRSCTEVFLHCTNKGCGERREGNRHSNV